MSTDYSFRLIFGIKLTEDKIYKTWGKTEKTDGVFHMEDRFDPKTGEKLKPIKIWDKKPKSDTFIF